MGMDFSVFKEKTTWKAFAVSIMMFSVIAYAGLSIFGLTSNMLSTGGDVRLSPDFEIETVNRTDVEGPLVNETGWFKLSEHRGKVIILDFMAHDCSGCHVVQSKIENSMGAWQEREGGYEVFAIAIGSWYDEDMTYLNTSDSKYHVPYYPTGMGSVTAAISNNTTGERADIRTAYNVVAIPIAYVLDHEGYIVGTLTDGVTSWNQFNDSVEAAIDGEAEENRVGLREIETNFLGVFFLGMMLSILVYFSPCAFPVLPGFISYYLSLGMREKEMIDSGQLKGKMPKPIVIGLLSGLGMWTFFLFIGLIAVAMGEAFARSGLIYYIALGVAVLLVILGFFMLTGGTAHLMGWVDKLIQKWSTTEQDEVFTPRRNMYLYGIGYAAASIDCTAAAVLPFIIYLSTLGSDAVFTGLGALMIGLLLLMMIVTMMVSLGSQVMVNFLKQATAMIKMVGSWMMMFAGIGLTIFITQPQLF